MSRTNLIPVAILALVAGSVLHAGDVYTGAKPTSVTAAFDKRTELEKLEDRVNELDFLLDEALYVIDANEQRISELEAVVAQNQAFVNDLKDHIAVTDTSMTLAADRINLNADRVDVNADRTTVDGSLESDELHTDWVDAESYSPGAGNIL